MSQRPPELLNQPTSSAQRKIYRVCMVFDRAARCSHLVEKQVINRVIDPARLPSGTWAVSFYDRMHFQINDRKMKGSPEERSPLTLIAEKIYRGRFFLENFREESQTLRHEGGMPVVQLPSSACYFDSDDLSGRYRVVPPGVRVIDTQGEIIWRPYQLD